MARKKKPLVTPKVVAQLSPPKRILWVVLPSLGVLLAMWFSYDYGRGLHAGTEKPGNATPDRSLEQRITQLEQERDQLKQRMVRLERKLQLGSKHVRDPEAIVRALSARKPLAPATAPPQAAKDGTSDATATGPSGELQLTDLEIERTGSDNHYRFSFSVTHPGSEADQVVGTIWIAVNGLLRGKPMRLSLKQVSSETRPYLDMRFRGRQGVDGELTLPPAFEPKNIAIEAKPYDKKYRGASRKFDWTADSQLNRQ